MTTHELETRISRLRGQVRRLLAAHGLSLVVAVAVSLAVVSGLLDWLFHLDSIVRTLLLISIAGALAYIAYRWILRPLVQRFDDLAIAMRIEKRWPGLRDRLTSTVQFLRLDPNDQRYGSAELREATVRKALEETSRIDFREVVEKRPIYQAVGLAAGAIGIAVLFALLDPVSSRLAVRRLLLPFGGDGAVDHIVGSYKTISIDGGFRRNNLMGIRPMPAPTRLVNAVIDREVARRPAGVRTSDDIVELD